MHTVSIPHKKITREIPSAIEEMTQGQFIFYISIVLEYLEGKINIDEFKVKLICKLLCITIDPSYFILPESEKLEISSNINYLAQLCETFFEEKLQDGKKVKVFRMSFTKNFIPRIGKYYGPADALNDVTFCEYRIAHQHYAAFVKSHEQNDLNRMIAALYRPRRLFYRIIRHFWFFDGQQRRPITSKTNPSLIEKRARKISRLPMPIRYGIFLYFSGCEEFLQKGSIEIEGKKIDFSCLYDQETKIDGLPDIGAVGLLFTMAETHVFGSIDETDNQNLYDIMIRLYQVVKQNKAIEAQYKKNDTD